MKLSRRLEVALLYTKGFSTLRDVGCDHAYFPIEAISRGYVTSAIASDNKQAPFENALSNVQEASLSHQIEVKLLEGLDELTCQQDLVSILGMGGNLIKEILEKADLKCVKRLILSPNSDAYVLRDYLAKNRFKIDSEMFIKDKGKYYQIIIASSGKMRLSELEKRFGPFILKEKNNDFREYIVKLIKQLEKGFESSSTESQKGLLDEIHTLKECL